jgi:hypothetical protein
MIDSQLGAGCARSKVTHFIIRSLIPLLGLLATAAPAETCAPGVSKLHGKCKRVAPVVEAPGVVNGVVRITVDSSDIKVGPFTAKDVRSAVEADAGVDVHNAQFTGIDGRGLGRFGIRLRFAYSTTISDFDLTHSSALSVSPNLPGGIVIGGGDGITIRDGQVSGYRMAQSFDALGKPVYLNGDGVAIEEGAQNVTIERVTATDNSDGGFDLKLGAGSWLDGLTAAWNNRGFRIWYQAEAGMLESIDNKTAVWIGGSATTVRIRRLVAKSRVPARVFLFDAKNKGIILKVGSCDLTGMAKGSTLGEGFSGNKVTLGPGCRL